MRNLKERYRHEDYIEQREGNKCWSFRVKYNGKSRTFREDDYIDPKEAFRQAIKFRNELVTVGTYVRPNVTIYEVMLESFDILLVRQKTRLNHITLFNRYIKQNIEVIHFNEEFVYKVLNSLVDSYSDDVISRVFSLFKRIDKVCLIKKYYGRSVVASVICPKSHKITHRTQKQPITYEQLQLVKQTFMSAKTQFEREQLPLLLDFFYLTGCRPCEVWCLTWQDTENDCIDINKEVGSNTTEERVIRPPKTQLSNRTIPINAELKTLLKSLKNVNYKHFKKDVPLLFPTKNNEMYVTDIIGARIKKYAKKVNVNFNLYDLRKRFATDLTLNGVDDRTRMELLGHSSINITNSVYAISNLEAKIEALNNRNFPKVPKDIQKNPLK